MEALARLAPFTVKKNKCNFTESDGSRVAMNFVKIQIGVIFLLQALLAFKDFKIVAHLTI